MGVEDMGKLDLRDRNKQEIRIGKGSGGSGERGKAWEPRVVPRVRRGTARVGASQRSCAELVCRVCILLPPPRPRAKSLC